MLDRSHIDTNVQNPRVSGVGAWGAGEVDASRTRTIFDQRRFVVRATPVFQQAGGAGGLINRQNCRSDTRVLKQGNVRIFTQSSGWSYADIDEDGNADGFVVNSDLTANLSAMPAWDSLL